MAGSLSDYAEAKVLDHLVGKTSYTMPTIWVGLSTSDPGDAETGGGVSEPVGNSYARVATDGDDWDAAADGAIANAEIITFLEASGDWGTITHFALFDAESGGNMIAHGNVDTSKGIDDGDTAKFSVGALDITLD